MSRRPRILFVAMHHSIHVARWIGMVANRGWDLHLFPLDPGEPNPNLKGVTLHWPEPPEGPKASAEIPPLSSAPASRRRPLDRARRFAAFAMRDPCGAIALIKRRLSLPVLSAAPSEAPVPVDAIRLERFRTTLDALGGPEAIARGQVRLGESDAAAPVLNGPGVLASVIRRVQPDLIHSMEFQHAGYLVLRARELYGPDFPRWLATNWGSDIFYFRRFEDHRQQITRLLQATDYYSCECHRDIGLAQELGYQGPALAVLPNSGGFDLDHLAALRSPEPPSRRKLLMIKGYHHFAGRAMTSMRVLESIAERLRKFEIILYSVSSEPRKKAFELVEKGTLNIRVIDWATHDEILSYFGRARLYMGVSISDAISTSVLEAMAMGAFPIQTDTSCCDEWFKDGKSGFIISPDDFDTIRDRFITALEDDELVDRAAEINRRAVETRLDRRVLEPQIRTFYESILDSSGGPPPSRARSGIR